MPMSDGLTNEQKRKIALQRQFAVRAAWKDEKNRVSEGIGSRKWSDEEQKELLETGRVAGYDGHHMKSVSLYPEYAAEPNNIQFLSEDEHFNGAHQGNYHNLTNGYYDPNEGQMHEFGDELRETPKYDLKTGEVIEAKKDENKEENNHYHISRR